MSSRAVCQVAPSIHPPGNCGAGSVPQFVCIGWDDNYYPEGMRWIIDFLKDKKNADGTPARCSFYVNTNNAFYINNPKEKMAAELVAIWNQAQQQGHEIGNHTATHAEGLRDASTAVWEKEIITCQADLAQAGVDVERINGFRSPFLLYSDATFSVVQKLQFKYDCSIESGFNPDNDGTRFLWPYTLDNGVAESDRIPAITVTKHPGLWEVPVHCVIVPEALRERIWRKRYAADQNTMFDPQEGKITGLDYNLWIDPDATRHCGLTAEEYLETLIYSLDKRLSSNRAPLCFGAHTPLYDSLTLPHPTNQWPEYHSNASLTEMRSAMEAFITYALAKPAVRIVPLAILVAWMEEHRVYLS
ncbi:MAG: polysaccharide deacetylase family protein [Chitinivibrionales bacterium]|nr:polysaccharide deacetylase family protein [Chitinivibrionales bacterium]